MFCSDSWCSFAGDGVFCPQSRGIQDFIEHIRRNKIVYLEDLAAEFGLKTQVSGTAVSRQWCMWS